MATAAIGNATIHYEVVGQGSPLVLLHAGIADSRMWAGQLESFSQRYQVITYDMRGFGQTVPVPESYSQHEDLAALLAQLGIEKATLVGCSNGGRIAINFALAYPERTTALVLVNPAVEGFKFSGTPPAITAQIDAAGDEGDLDTVAELEVQLWVDGLYRQPDQVDPAIRDLVRQMNRHALINDLNPIGEEADFLPPAVDRLAELALPILLVTGELDTPASLERAALIQQHAPQVRPVVMTNTAHLPNMERPAEFNHHVLEFLEQVIP